LLGAHPCRHDRRRRPRPLTGVTPPTSSLCGRSSPSTRDRPSAHFRVDTEWDIDDVEFGWLADAATDHVAGAAYLGYVPGDGFSLFAVYSAMQWFGEQRGLISFDSRNADFSERVLDDDRTFRESALGHRAAGAGPGDAV
jgi:hypothetical protein